MDKLLSSHKIISCSDNLFYNLSTEDNILFGQFIILTAQDIILSSLNNILSSQVDILFASHMIISSLDNLLSCPNNSLSCSHKLIRHPE